MFRFRGPRYPPRFVSRSLRLRSRKVGGAFRAGVTVQPATRLPACSHVDVSGISQVPRRSILCLCLGPRPRPNRRSLAYCRFHRCCPHSDDSEGFSVMVISGLSRGLSTCCLRFMSGVAVIHARLASGWLARLYRDPLDRDEGFQITSSSLPGLFLAQRPESLQGRKPRLGKERRCRAGAMEI